MTVIKRAIEFCCSPVGMLALMCLAGLVLAARRRTAKTGLRLLVAGAVLFLLLLWTPLAELVVAPLERPYVAAPAAPTQRAAVQPIPSGVRFVVVLAGYGEDRPALPVTSRLWPDTAARIVEGLRVYRQLPGAKLVVSGGVLRTGQRPVAQLMADFAVALGVPREDVVLEQTSKTTYENLVEVKKIVGAEPFVLVNSACDLRRAMAVARKLGMKATPSPAAVWSAHRYPAGQSWRAFGWQVLDDLRPSPGRFTYIQWAWHEYVGYVWYRLLGRA